MPDSPAVRAEQVATALRKKFPQVYLGKGPRAHQIAIVGAVTAEDRRRIRDICRLHGGAPFALNTPARWTVVEMLTEDQVAAHAAPNGTGMVADPEYPTEGTPS